MVLKAKKGFTGFTGDLRVLWVSLVFRVFVFLMGLRVLKGLGVLKSLIRLIYILMFCVDKQTNQRSFGNKRILAKKNTKNYHGRNLEMFFFFCPMLKIGLFGNFGNFM